MSFNVGVEIAGANHFVGLVAGAQRAELHQAVIDEDSRRKFWLSHMLPMLTESFLDHVIEKPYVRFHLPGLDDLNTLPRHTAVFQSFAHLCAPLASVPVSYVPWQFRFILDKCEWALNSSLATDNALRKDVFDKAGWVFWITSNGFCITPKTVCDKLSDISAMYTAWNRTRDELEFTPDVAAAHRAETEAVAAEAAASREVPLPPALERLSGLNV